MKSLLQQYNISISSVKATWWYKYMHHCITQNLLYTFQLTMEQLTGVDDHWLWAQSIFVNKILRNLTKNPFSGKMTIVGFHFCFQWSQWFLFLGMLYIRMHFVLKQRSILYSLRNFTYVHKLHIRNGFKAQNEWWEKSIFLLLESWTLLHCDHLQQ